VHTTVVLIKTEDVCVQSLLSGTRDLLPTAVSRFSQEIHSVSCSKPPAQANVLPYY
jgi:hypothetical protein